MTSPRPPCRRHNVRRSSRTNCATWRASWRKWVEREWRHLPVCSALASHAPERSAPPACLLFIRSSRQPTSVQSSTLCKLHPPTCLPPVVIVPPRVWYCWCSSRIVQSWGYDEAWVRRPAAVVIVVSSIDRSLRVLSCLQFLLQPDFLVSTCCHTWPAETRPSASYFRCWHSLSWRWLLWLRCDCSCFTCWLDFAFVHLPLYAFIILVWLFLITFCWILLSIVHKTITVEGSFVWRHFA